MDGFYSSVWLFVACCGAIFGLFYWLVWRGNRKKARKHDEKLTALATKFGGTMTKSAEVSAWSAELLPPMKGDTEGLVNRIVTVSRPRFDTALDFQHGKWLVRVTEASMKRSGSNGTRTLYEHRIEVATSQLAPIKISRRWHTDFRGRPLTPDHILKQGGELVREAPLTVSRNQGQWIQIELPTPMDSEFVAFTSDRATAIRTLNPQVGEWLVAQVAVMPRMLTFESGLVYATMHGQINPDSLLPMLDSILGLLDRSSNIAPRHTTHIVH